jgi:hypothetical protein
VNALKILQYEVFRFAAHETSGPQPH